MKTLTLSPKGLYTNSNTLSEVPEGALSVASNVVCSRPGIVSSRRGLGQYLDAITTAKKMFTFNQDLLLYSDGKLKYDNTTAWSSGNALSYPASGYRPKSAQANRNFYITSGTGVQKLAVKTAVPALAGVPGALDVVITAPAGGGGFLPNGESVRYRVLFGTVDANSNLIIGAPCLHGYLVTNSAGSASNVAVSFTLPAGLTSSHFYRVYRTYTAAGEPGDEMYLAVQRDITSGDLSTGTITVTDVTANDQLGVPLYTNSTQEGILNLNSRPPHAYDVATFNDHTFYARTRREHQLTLTMVSVPAADETLTINSVVFTAKNSETIASGFFNRSGTIDATCRSLCTVVNRYASNTTTYAYYLGDGKILIKRRDYTDTAFTVSASVATRYNFDRTTSDALVHKNGITISKPNEPEAAPDGREFLVGTADAAIIRVVPSRDALYILKEDGVFRLTGTAFEDMVVEEHVATIRIRGDENAVRFENSVIAACNQGIVLINSNGYQRISQPIDNLVIPPLDSANIGENSFAVAYDTERLFLIRLPRLSDNSAEFFCFSGETQQWTQWERQDVHGVVANEKLYLTTATQAYEERKSLNRTDFADESYGLTITSAVSTTVTVSVATNIVAGMTLVQGNEEQVITAVSGNDLTVENALFFTAGAATAYTPIRCEIQFVEHTAGDPTKMKHFLETTGLFEDASFEEIEFSWGTNLTSLYARTVVRGKNNAPWGKFAWGQLGWGGRFTGKAALRTYIPRRASRALWLFPRLVLEQAFESFSFAGFSIKYNEMTDKFRSR